MSNEKNGLTIAERNELYERLDDAYKFAKKKIDDEEEETAPPEFDDHKRTEVLHKKQVPLKPGIVTVSKYTDIKDVFDFSKFYKAENDHKKKFEKQRQSLILQTNKVKSIIISGKMQQALDAISKIEGA